MGANIRFEPAESATPRLIWAPTFVAMAFTHICESDQPLAGELDRRRASFDKLRMRDFLRASKIFPHPELVEGRGIAVQRYVHAIAAKAGAHIPEARVYGPRLSPG